MGIETIDMLLEAICLNVKKTSATEAYITLFSRQMGIVDVYAKNIKSTKSKNAKGAIPFIYGNYFISGKGPYQMSGVDIKEYFYNLREDYESYIMASIMAKVLIKSMPIGTPNPSLFELYINSVSVFNKHKELTNKMFLYFEVRLSHELGIGIQVDTCSICKNKPVFYDSVNTEAFCSEHSPVKGKDESLYLSLISRAANSKLVKFLNLKIEKEIIDNSYKIIERHIFDHLGINIERLRMEKIDYLGG